MIDDFIIFFQPFECELQVDTSSEKKQDWSFTLYDFDGKGKITKEELGNLFQALYDAVGSSIRLPLNGTKKLKLRLSIGHDHSHLDTTLKDQSPPLVKKKAKLKNSSRLTEWKEMSLQAGAGGSTRVAMADPKECTKLNNLDASPRAKPSTMSKMENQLTATTPGIGHRLMLSCREQRKLTEMVHENMVRNHVRQQTGRKHHHSGHRHHHHHREARRHRGTRRQGDENRKPREKERTYYLDLGNIERSAPPNGVSLPYSAGIPTPTSTTTATVTTSVMTFARPTIINIVPSSSSPPPPPPPPPTASGSTAHCNEIGMVADNDNNDSSDDVLRLEVGGKVNRRKYDNTWRETGWQLNTENVPDLQQRNTNASADGRETTAGSSTLTSAVTISTATATTTTTASSQCDKKTSDRSGKRTGEERHKKHSESYHHTHIGRTLSQERSGQAVTTPVSSSVSAVMSKMTAPGGIPGALAERKSLRTHYKTDASHQQTSSRHRAHCQNTLVPEKNAGTPPLAVLPSSVSPSPPTPNIAVATTTNGTRPVGIWNSMRQCNKWLTGLIESITTSRRVRHTRTKEV
ncbi:NKD [Acanthosepion pharaonis]|uniref:Protein naked cuticle homolog n=1 Tax=Acanthosepion pharaonis TaxID=158019 RepID=A0A812ECM0_ACAPH|nr:NKD [Sepia pharaonis]